MGSASRRASKASRRRAIRCRRKTIDSIRRTRLALKGPLETPSGGGYRSSNVRLREEFKLYANLRPARTLIPGGRFDNIDLVVVRENLEGLYIGHEHYIQIDDDPHAVAMATGVNTRQGSRRLLEFAFEHAVATGRKKVTIVHKANIMKALTGIFLETGLELYERKYKGRFTLETVIIDACAMKLVLNPWQFDVLVTTNLFGDILSDLVAGLVGGLGMTPGANIGADAAIFEAVHGSAPDIAGKGIANPIALLLAAAMMLEHCHLPHMARAPAYRASIKRSISTRCAPATWAATRARRSSPARWSSASRMPETADGMCTHAADHLDRERHQILRLRRAGAEAHQSRDRARARSSRCSGPNGAGKTTLINIVCGIVTASSGRVTADGHDIVRDYRAARSKIGLVPQELTTDAFETVWATVTFSRGLFGRAPNPALHRGPAARSVAARTSATARS